MRKHTNLFRLKKTDSERAVFVCLFLFRNLTGENMVLSKSSVKKFCSTEGIQLKKSQQFH